MVNLMALWSESRDKLGSIAQCLKVSCQIASVLAKDRSMTEGRLPSCLARCVISPFWLNIKYLWSMSQLWMSMDNWLGSSVLSSLDQAGWCRLKLPVRMVGWFGSMLALVRSLLRMQRLPFGESLYMLITVTVGWSIWVISRNWMLRSSMRLDLRVMEKSGHGLK